MRRRKKKQRIYRYRLPESKESSAPYRAQYPGGLTRWLTRVHFGTSASSQSVSRTQSRSRGRGINILCTPFRYFFALRSNSVYLSLGSISASVGISSFHRSTAAATMPCFASALSTHATMRSTRRSRCRCRYFCMLDMRHGIFLRPLVSGGRLAAGGGLVYQRRPPFSGCEGRRKPNIAAVERGVGGLSVAMDGGRRRLAIAAGGGLVSRPE